MNHTPDSNEFDTQDLVPDLDPLKHDKFLRLMQERLNKVAKMLNLISNLAGRHYAHTSEEAEAVVELLDTGVHDIAQKFKVPYHSAIGELAVDEARKTGFKSKAVTGNSINEVDIVKTLELLKMGETARAADLLKKALRSEER